MATAVSQEAEFGHGRYDIIEAEMTRLREVREGEGDRVLAFDR